MNSGIALPDGVRVFERGWLSSNNILFKGHDSNALVDSGYDTHSTQTLALVEAALGDQDLQFLVNTHLHSDHCGGNALLQERYPNLQTLIPPGLSSHVQNWDPDALTFAPTGQRCKPFSFNEILKMNSEVQLGYSTWQVHAAPGHDPHSVVLFEPQSRTLISADALWENGFGVVFPELVGTAAFDEVSRTIDLIESLAPQLVIPGHGPVFSDVRGAIGVARRRLNDFVKNPAKHIHYASKVLLKFKLLEVQQIELQALLSWASSTYYFVLIHAKHFKDSEFDMWINQLLTDLANSKAIVCDGQLICNK